MLDYRYPDESAGSATAVQPNLLAADVAVPAKTHVTVGQVDTIPASVTPTALSIITTFEDGRGAGSVTSHGAVQAQAVQGQAVQGHGRSGADERNRCAGCDRPETERNQG